MSFLSPRTIADALGGDVTGRNSVNVPGPGHCKIDRSLAIKLSSGAPGGFVVFSHAGDDPMTCRDYIRERLGLGSWVPGTRMRPRVAADAGSDETKARLKQLALKIWAQSVNPIGSIVEHYLREKRALELTADIAGGVIRFHGSLYVDRQTRSPGMVCLLRNIATDEPCGIHRTFLDRNTGEKTDRKMLGVARSAAIKFDPLGAQLTIGEGVETGLSGRAAGLGLSWALGSSGAVRVFPVLRPLEELTILQENDPTSRRDVKVCAGRYLGAGKPVKIVTPRTGNDLNDVWKAARR